MTTSFEPQPIEPSSLGSQRYLVGTLTLVERMSGRWAVRDLTTPEAVKYLSADGEWSSEGGRGPAWEAAHWHDFDTALRLAREAQPTHATPQTQAKRRHLSECAIENGWPEAGCTCRSDAPEWTL